MKILLRCLRSALPSTWKSASWLMKLMIPITLIVTLLQHFGILEWIAGYLNPIFSYFGLPGSSAVIFISGAAAGTYSGIAAMMSIHLTLRQATILGIMIALCHALPMECAVNRKTGSSFWKMAVIRIAMAFLSAFILNILLPELSDSYVYIGAKQDSAFTDVVLTWALSQAKMCITVFLIIYALMVVQRLIEAFHLLEPLSRLLAPLMRLFGLPRQVSYMWLVGNVLGISYGSAVMLELQEKGLINKEDANDVNYHLIMNHSMLEDTIVFAATGISAIWMISARLLFAIALVWARKTLMTGISKLAMAITIFGFSLSMSAQTKSLKIDTFTTFPEEIDGGCCRFYINQQDMEDGNYLMVNDMASTAILYINGEKNVFTAKKVKKGEIEQTFENKNYILKVQVNSITNQRYESYSFRGWITLKAKKGKIEKSIAFIGTCEW